MDWNIIALAISIAIFLLALILPRITSLPFHRPLTISAVLAIIVGIVMLLYLPDITEQLRDQGSDPNIISKVLFAAQLILTVNAGIELVKWLVMAIGKRRNMRLPRFLLDVMGWVLLIVVSPFIVQAIVGEQMTSLVVSSTVVSAVVALSLQSLLSSFFAGIALQIESPFLPDDWVEVDGQEGKVVRMNWRTLALVTRRNETVILPNGSVAQQKITNYSRPSALVALDTWIGASYSDPPNGVKRVLRESLRGVAGIVTEREPQIILWEYADSGIVYRVRFWVNDFGRKYEIIDAAQTRYWYALKRAGYSIPFPQRDVHLYPVEPQDDEHVELAHQQLAQYVSQIDLFSTLSQEQCSTIAAGARTQTFTAGEQLVRQGAVGDSLFIITSGEAMVQLHDEHGHDLILGTRTVGDFLGEMSLLTGEPRTATVLAKDDVEVVVIDADTFRASIAADPDILERLTDALQRRRSNVESKLAEHAALVDGNSAESPDFIRRVRRFLGIRT